MMLYSHLTLVLLFCTGASLHIDNGCVASDEWNEAFLSPDFNVSVWIPDNDTRTYYLNIRLVITDLHYADITFTHETVSAIVRVDLLVQRNITFHKSKFEGWQSVAVRRRDNYELTFGNFGNESVVFPGDLLPEVPSSVEVKGRHVTMDCNRGVRVWKVAQNTQVAMPLVNDCKRYWLSLFSYYEVTVTLILENRRITLGKGQNGMSVTDVVGDLSAFREHHFSLDCAREEKYFVCNATTRESSEYERRISLEDPPRHLIVEGSSDDFYVLLYKDDPFLETSQAPVAGSSAVCGSICVAVLIIVGGIAMIILITLSSIIYLRRHLLKGKLNDHKSEETPEEIIPLIQDDVNHRETTNNSPQETRILSAVREGKVKRVEHEMKQRDPGYEAEVEAHLRGNIEIVKLFSSKQPSLNETVNKVLPELKKRIDDVFQAAKEGAYKTGVDMYLRYYQLPASIRDSDGKSLLHHIASCIDYEGAPLWEEKDAREFLSEHNIFPNAVDYKGQTCLHALALSASNSRAVCRWSNKEVEVEDAWLELARVLVEAGCDPSVVDHAMECPHTLAKEKGKMRLHNYLHHETKARRHTKDDSEETALRDAISKGDIKTMIKLMLPTYPLPPLRATTALLIHAIKRQQVEATALLLSAGTPSCVKPLVSITPLEVADDPRLSAIFPAMLRREYANRLLFEKSKLCYQYPPDNDPRKELEYKVNRIAQDIEQNGKQVILKTSPGSGLCYNNNAKEYLCIAASLGLSAVCQILCLENVFLQPLPHEEKPVKRAIENKQWQTLVVLYRDLNVSLFSITDEDEMPKRLLKEVMDYENKKLKKFCANWNSDVLEKDITLLGSIKEYLQVVAKKGLVSIYHALRKREVVKKIDDPVENLTGYNMLHLAAMYGQLNMVEYLLFNDANAMARGERNETALHLAALRGNRDCMYYLKIHMSTNKYPLNSKVFTDLTAERIYEGYKALIKENELVLLPKQHGETVLSKVSATDRTKALLDVKIPDRASFLRNAEAIASKQQNSCQAVESEINNLLHVISKCDARFKGKRIIPNRKGNLPTMQSQDSLQVYWEVDFTSYGKAVEPLHCREKCSLIMLLPYPFDSCFKDEFYKAIRKAMSVHRFSSKCIWLTYPCITNGDIGTTLYLTHYDKGTIRLLRVLIVPMLKAKYPKDNENAAVSKLLDPLFKDPFPIYIASKSRNKWTYIVVQLEREILAHISENQRLVLTACTLLTNVLYSPWWFPREENRRHGQTWGHYACGLAAIPQRLLISLFFEELSSTTDEDWGHSKFLERVTSIFRRATCEVAGERKLREVPLFLDSKYSVVKASPIIFSVIDHLEGLKLSDQMSLESYSQ